MQSVETDSEDVLVSLVIPFTIIPYTTISIIIELNPLKGIAKLTDELWDKIFGDKHAN